jgi:hypothetical protein
MEEAMKFLISKIQSWNLGTIVQKSDRCVAVNAPSFPISGIFGAIGMERWAIHQSLKDQTFVFDYGGKFNMLCRVYNTPSGWEFILD